MEEKMNPGLDPVVDEEMDQVSGGAGDNRIHVVQKGENIRSISKKYGVKWRDLYKLNTRTIGPDPDVVPAGLQLKIPQ